MFVGREMNRTEPIHEPAQGLVTSLKQFACVSQGCLPESLPQSQAERCKLGHQQIDNSRS